MHTPRFSGQPANAGDLVFVRIPSRPMRTSCANVGTVFPRLARLPLLTGPFSLASSVAENALLGTAGKRKTRNRAHNFNRRSPRAQTTLASAHTTLKGLLRIRRDQQETPHALQEAELLSWLRFGEAYSAFAGLASHIRPLFASNPSCFVPEAKILPTTRTTNPHGPSDTTRLNEAL